MPKGQCNEDSVNEMRKEGYVLTRVAAETVGVDRDTIHTWATGGTDGAPIRVRSKKHARYLFAHLKDCLTAAGKPVQIKRSRKK